MMPFFCEKCGDFDLEPKKYSNRWVSWYQSKCPKCGMKLIRHENPKGDPYYAKSKRVIIMRDKFRKDLLQFGDAGFEMYYKKQHDEFVKQRQAYEEKQIAKKKEFDAFYSKAKYETQGNTQVMRKLVAIEEKMNNG